MGSSTATTTGSGLGSGVWPGAEFCLHFSVTGVAFRSFTLYNGVESGSFELP